MLVAAVIVIPSHDQTAVISGGQSLAKIVRRVEANYLERETLWNWENLGQHHLNLDLLLFCPQTDISLTSRNSSAWKEDSSPLPPEASKVGGNRFRARPPGKHAGPWECGELERLLCKDLQRQSPRR